MSPVAHIVCFRYRSNIAWTELEKHFQDFAALQKTCLKPNGKPYMLGMRMGKNHSWESLSRGMTHAFILDFASEEDRDYYCLKDPVHHAFSAKANPMVEDSMVFDIDDGKLFADSSPKQAMSHTGSCHCGQIKFEVQLDDPQHIMCHCRTCQLMSGGPYSANAIVKQDAFRITQGQPKVYSYAGASGKSVNCYHCGNCTSHLYHVQMVAPDNVIVRTLLLDNASKLGVGGEIFSEDGLYWAKDLKNALPS